MSHPAAEVYSNALRAEYADLIAELPPAASRDRIIAALVADADWTPTGAATVHDIATMYGTSILRSALALAEALEIEDGSAGM
jgi:hypothetical protein